MKTVNSRFYRWRESGVWQRILEGLQARAEMPTARPDWRPHRRHGHPGAHCGRRRGKGGDHESEALGYRREILDEDPPPRGGRVESR
ncbi:MAG: hypothetical protein U0325_02645 [Polyangiales bacterium]